MASIQRRGNGDDHNQGGKVKHHYHYYLAILARESVCEMHSQVALYFYAF